MFNGPHTCSATCMWNGLLLLQRDLMQIMYCRIKFKTYLWLYCLILLNETFLLPFFFFFFFLRFTLFLERAPKQGREKEGEKILSRLHAQHRAQRGTWSHDPGIMTWAEIKSWTLNQLSYPGIPLFYFYSWEKRNLEKWAQCRKFWTMLERENIQE